MLFFVGILEMLIVTIWTKVVTKSKVLASGVVTVINVMIWYYVVQTIVDNISDWKIALMYALGCAIGTAGSTYFYQIVEKKKRAEKRAARQKQILSNGLQTIKN